MFKKGINFQAGGVYLFLYRQSQEILSLKILYDFEGKCPEELSIKKGEIVSMVLAESEWTKVKTEDCGTTGIIPRNYYVYMDEEIDRFTFALEDIIFANYDCSI